MSNYVFPDGIIGEAAEAAYLEARRATEELNFPRFTSLHEGYAVLLEEVDEMWEEIKSNNKEAAVYEAIQVAAMALRIVSEFGEYPFKKPKKTKFKDEILDVLRESFSTLDEIFEHEKSPAADKKSFQERLEAKRREAES